MTFQLTWLGDVLAGPGLQVAPTSGWQARGHGDVGVIKGVMCHHTAGPASGNMPSLDLVIAGRSDLSGPLCNLALGRDGTWYLVAAGRAYHAGAGVWNGVATGNSSFIGIEAENVGTSADPWPDAQMDAYRRGVAALLAHIGADETWCCGHKEYAPGRKIDPSFDMAPFRAGVKAILAGTVAALQPIAPADAAGRLTLRRGATGEAVKTVQTAVGATADGVFGADTEAQVRIFQRAHDLVPDGIVGPATWAAIGPP